MKKITVSILSIMLIFLLFGCEKSSTENVKIDYKTSSIYTKDDMDNAIQKIKEKFKSMEGCELHSLSYSSDDICTKKETIAWMNDLRKENYDNKKFTQCIMFDSSFRSPKKSYGNWNPDEEYKWSWWLARSEEGQWKLMTYGY